MKIFRKAEDFTLAREARVDGAYPFFLPIQESTATRVRMDGRWLTMLGSNNYLGLTHDPRVVEAQATAVRRWGSGSTGSRLLNGTLDLHVELESRLARLLGKEAALVFSTGYQTNLGVLQALGGRDDRLFLDRLNHACIVDGARLSLARVRRYPHGDLGALDTLLQQSDPAKGRLIATDGVFSMDGDVVDLPTLVDIARKHDAGVLVDDAHGIGVLGEGGAGTTAHFGLTDRVDLITATFSKSLASIGGVVAASAELIDFLRHHARSLVFSASLPPAAAAGVLAALDVLRDEPERRLRLLENTRYFGSRLKAMGLPPLHDGTPILPIVMGDLRGRVIPFWYELFHRGVFTNPVGPPAVAPDQSRIRVSVTSEHTREELDQALEAFQGAAAALGVER